MLLTIENIRIVVEIIIKLGLFYLAYQTQRWILIMTLYYRKGV